MEQDKGQFCELHAWFAPVCQAQHSRSPPPGALRGCRQLTPVRRTGNHTKAGSGGFAVSASSCTRVFCDFGHQRLPGFLSLSELGMPPPACLPQGVSGVSAGAPTRDRHCSRQGAAGNPQHPEWAMGQQVGSVKGGHQGQWGTQRDQSTRTLGEGPLTPDREDKTARPPPSASDSFGDSQWPHPVGTLRHRQPTRPASWHRERHGRLDTGGVGWGGARPVASAESTSAIRAA